MLFTDSGLHLSTLKLHYSAGISPTLAFMPGLMGSGFLARLASEMASPKRVIAGQPEMSLSFGARGSAPAGSQVVRIPGL